MSITDEEEGNGTDLIPLDWSHLKPGEEDPEITRAMTAQGYVGAKFKGVDPATGNQYYSVSTDTGNLKIVYVPSLSRIVPFT